MAVAVGYMTSPAFAGSTLALEFRLMLTGLAAGPPVFPSGARNLALILAEPLPVFLLIEPDILMCY